MALIDKETIRAEIKRRKEKPISFSSDFENGCVEGNNNLCDDLLAFLDTLKETPTWVSRAEQRKKDQANGKKIAIMEIRAEIKRRINFFAVQGRTTNVFRPILQELESVLAWLDTLPEQPVKGLEEEDRMRYCIEYINPQYPLLYNGELNIRHLRVPDEHGAEMALTLMLSLGAKIYALYRGNVKEGKLGEWPTPMIVEEDDWYSVAWLHDILDCGCAL